MKWMILTIIIILVSGCCCTSSDSIEYRQVLVSPVAEPVLVGFPDYVDVTSSTIDFY